MTIFTSNAFIGHSGATLYGKVECDGFSLEDWRGMATMVNAYVKLPPFTRAVGVPRGGIILAVCMSAYGKADIGERVLVTDDVLTTGNSILKMMGMYQQAIGLVAFDRSQKPLPPNVYALWSLPR